MVASRSVSNLKCKVCELEDEKLSNCDLGKDQSTKLALFKELLFNQRVLEFKSEPVLSKLVLLVIGDHFSENSLESILFEIVQGLIHLVAAAYATPSAFFLEIFII